MRVWCFSGWLIVAICYWLPVLFDLAVRLVAAYFFGGYWYLGFWVGGCCLFGFWLSCFVVCWCLVCYGVLLGVLLIVLGLVSFYFGFDFVVLFAISGLCCLWWIEVVWFCSLLLVRVLCCCVGFYLVVVPGLVILVFGRFWV